MKKKYLELFASLALVTGCLFYFYGNILLQPNHHLTCDGGDGIKAFAVFAGHIKNDTGYTNYKNMNYPYGQTHLFTDGQTGIANILKFLSGYDPFFLNNCIGIYNLMMILSYVGCALFIFLILSRLSLPSFFKIAGTLCITLLSPQVFRLLGHPTLSYTVFFPLSWWLLIKFKESRNKILWTALIIINSSSWFFVHPYYVMLSGLFYFLYWMVHFFQFRKHSSFSGREIIYGLASAILPIILTRLYVSSADFHVGRPESPYGFWSYYANFNTVFMPLLPPFDQAFKFFFFWDKNQHWEGMAYVGLPSVFIAYFTVIKYLRYLFRKNGRLIVQPVLPYLLKTALPASILVLAFSMCYPFRIGFAFLLDWFTFLKQFRSLGRFAWCFYYVFTVYAVYTLWLMVRFLRGKKLILLANTFTVLSFGFFLTEGCSCQSNTSGFANRSPNYFNYSQVPDDYREIIDKINSIRNNYQCLIPLPFYSVGNENFDNTFTDAAIRSSMIISYWCDIPLLANSSARSSMVEGKNIMQFFSPPFFKKEIEKDLPDKKPFLVLYTREALNMQEFFYYSRSALLLENSSFILAELPYSKVFNSTAVEELDHFNKIRNTLKEQNGFLTDSATDLVFYEGFEGHPSKNVYRGNGASAGIKRDNNYLAKKQMLHLKKNREYVFSLWHYNRDELRNQVTCVIDEADHQGKNGDWSKAFFAGETMIIDGDWSMIQKKFTPAYDDGIISVFVTGDRHSKQEIFDDELLICPADHDVYRVVSTDKNGNATAIIKNNILIK